MIIVDFVRILNGRATDHHHRVQDHEGWQWNCLLLQVSYRLSQPTNNPSSSSSTDLNKLKINNLCGGTNEPVHE